MTYALTKLLFSDVVPAGLTCKKEEAPDNTPSADFTLTITNSGVLRAAVRFTSTAANATGLLWSFGNGDTSTSSHPQTIYTRAGTYHVKLVVALVIRGTNLQFIPVKDNNLRSALGGCPYPV